MDAPTIAVGICSYGNLKGLNDTLSSVAPLVDSVIVVNVPFLGFPVPEADPPLHTYEKSLILQRPNITLYQTSEPMTQIECRNKYLELTNADFLLVMDDDELIKLWNTSDTRLGVQQTLQRIIDKQKDTPNIYAVCLHQKRDDCPPVELPRLLYLPNRWRYTGNHYNFLVDGKYRGPSAHDSIHWSTIVIKHNDWQKAQRTAAWEKSMERYEIWQLSGGEQQVFNK